MPAKKSWEDYPEPVVDTDSGCLRWQGPHTRGYGTIGGRGSAHRVAWERENGPIPEGLTIDHVAARGCRWKDCVLVAHLEPVTRGENARRSGRLSAQMAREKCPKGHAYTEANTYIQKRGSETHRSCKQCRHDVVRRYRAKQKETTP